MLAKNRNVLLTVLSIVFPSQTYAAILYNDQWCNDIYQIIDDPNGNISYEITVGQSCETSMGATYDLQGTATLRTNGNIFNTFSVTASLSQELSLTEETYYDNSYGQDTTWGTGSYSLNMNIVNDLPFYPFADSAYSAEILDHINIGYSDQIFENTSPLSGSTVIGLAGQTLWDITADGYIASLMTLDGDNDGIAGIHFASSDQNNYTIELQLTAVPVPAAVWLFGSGFVALMGVA